MSALADIGAGRLNLRENSMVKKVWTITGEVPSCCARRYRLPAANYTAEKAPIYRLASSCAHDNRPRFRIRFLHPAVPSETGHLARLPHRPSVSAISSAANQCGERPGCISQSNDQHIALPNGRIAVGAVRGVWHAPPYEDQNAPEMCSIHCSPRRDGNSQGAHARGCRRAQQEGTSPVMVQTFSRLLGSETADRCDRLLAPATHHFQQTLRCQREADL